jgi:hypothetical protein
MLAFYQYRSLIRQSYEYTEPSCPPQVILKELKHLMVSSNQRISIPNLRKLLKECEGKHGRACNSREEWYLKASDAARGPFDWSSFTRKEILLIDVDQKRLVGARFDDRFLLSRTYGARLTASGPHKQITRHCAKKTRYLQNKHNYRGPFGTQWSWLQP